MTREEAMEIVKKLYNDSLFLKKDKEAMLTLVPELAESEDERILEWIIGIVNSCKELSFEDKVKLTKYLEKQKEQKPAEWDEEDEIIFKHCLVILHDYGYDEWLKSHLSYSHWKPSEEQMKALKVNVDRLIMQYPGNEIVLKSLYDDLKKLM